MFNYFLNVDGTKIPPLSKSCECVGYSLLYSFDKHWTRSCDKELMTDLGPGVADVSKFAGEKIS